MRERYFDNAATTPLDPRVLDAMLPWLTEGWGNAHSIHEPGRKAMEAVEKARMQVAELLGCEPEEIFFTSGATESNNWVLRAHPRALVGATEHSSVRETAVALGHEFMDAPEALTPGFPLVSHMLVNNEVGAVYNLIRPTGSKLHSDITQALGKIPINLASTDLASFSSHKFYGPKGVGGLFARHGDAPEPLMLGGEQEQDRRAGTLNVAGIVGMGAAAAIAKDEQPKDHELATSLRAIVLEELSGISELEVNDGEIVSPYILSLSFCGLEGETLVIEMDQAGFAISSGAACSAGSSEPSHVLVAMGIEPEWIRGTIRISFGRFNTQEAARDLGRTLKSTTEKIRRFH
ncbi:MAG: cysteine desulfurase family protein [Fimbriimonadaceae bacterium]